MGVVPANLPGSTTGQVYYLLALVASIRNIYDDQNNTGQQNRSQQCYQHRAKSQAPPNTLPPAGTHRSFLLPHQRLISCSFTTDVLLPRAAYTRGATSNL